MNNLDWIKSYLCTKIIQATPQELFSYVFTHFKGTSMIMRSTEAFSKWCENEWCPDSKIDTDEIVFQQVDQNTYRIAYRGYSGVVCNDRGEWIGSSLNRFETRYLNFRGKTRDECVQNFVEMIKEDDNPFPVNILAKGNTKVVISYDTESRKWKGIVLKDGSTKFVEGKTVEEVLLNSGLDETGKCGYSRQ